MEEKYKPEVHSEEEVAAMLKLITNNMYKVLIMKKYSASLRIDELTTSN